VIALASVPGSRSLRPGRELPSGAGDNLGEGTPLPRIAQNEQSPSGRPAPPVTILATAASSFLAAASARSYSSSPGRLDDAISAKLQACCINFNDAIKSFFGSQYALERRLPIALQFVTFSPDQRALLKKVGTLPRHVESMMDAFERQLTPEQQADPRFAFRVFMVHKTANRAPGADLAVELVPPGSDIAEKFNLALKEVEKRKYLPKEIVRMMKGEGWDRFTIDSHTKLWKRLNAQDPAKGYGAIAVGKQWCWYETWVNRVREECLADSERYGRAEKAGT
jgi:hypothetical protein